MDYTLRFLILLGTFILVVSCVQLVWESRVWRTEQRRKLRARDEARMQAQIDELYGKR